LTEPSALVLDSAGKDLLVVERDRITTIARSQLETGLTTAASEAVDFPPVAAPIPIQAVSGITVDRCTGKIYFTVSGNGTLQEYDPVAAKSRTVLSGLRSPGALLALYRAAVSCPNSLQLLVSEKGLDRTILVQPQDSSFAEWVAAPGVNDLLFLPDGNPFTNKEGVALGENSGSTGAVSIVKVSNLYQTVPPNPAPVPTTSGGANLVLTFDSSSVPQSSESCGQSPSWFFKLTATETGGVGVTVTRITWGFYDSSGNVINNQVNSGSDFATWFNECGAGSATIGPNGKACATLCAHLGGRSSGFVDLQLTVTEAGTNKQLTFSSARLGLTGSSSLTLEPEAPGPAAVQPYRR